jgi:flagellar M-ring protein FliF
MNQPPPPELAETSDDEDEPPIVSMKPNPQISKHEQNLVVARQLAIDDPRLVASVVKQWVAGRE